MSENIEKKVDLDWESIGFSYRKTEFRYISRWKDGKWDEGELVTENKITISEGAPVLHYAQSCFEGLKAFTTKDDEVVLFRPDQNAKRFNQSASYLLMPEVPEEKFINACIEAVKSNLRWVPPYGSGASLYIRPFMMGVGDNIGVKPASEYIFSVFVLPVGPYFKGGLSPMKCIVSDYDRAAPRGTGAVKFGGNYAASLKPRAEAIKAGFSECIYLDPQTHQYIDEAGSANFFGITKDNKFVTPKSPSVLPSITKYSLMYIAREYLDMTVEERAVPIDALDDFVEAGACGTAAVVAPIGGIEYNGKLHTFYKDGKEAGPVTKKLYDILTGIQKGEVDPPENWIVKVK